MQTLINIDVPELAPAIEFYREALGLQLRRIIDGDVAELEGGPSRIYLLANPAQSSTLANHARDYERHWTPVHIDFVVDDVETAARRAVNAGAIRESECVCWRGSRCVTFADPFGHGFCLIEFETGTYSDE